MNKIILIAPPNYVKLSTEEKKAICNGCGAKGGFPVPDTMYGLDMSEPCNIHDFMYSVGKTIADKEEADRVFLNNMLRIIDARTEWKLLKRLRYRRAKTYHSVVVDYGGPAFWKDKNLHETELII